MCKGSMTRKEATSPAAGAAGAAGADLESGAFTGAVAGGEVRGLAALDGSSHSACT